MLSPTPHATPVVPGSPTPHASIDVPRGIGRRGNFDVEKTPFHEVLQKKTNLMPIRNFTTGLFAYSVLAEETSKTMKLLEMTHGVALPFDFEEINWHAALMALKTQARENWKEHHSRVIILPCILTVQACQDKIQEFLIPANYLDYLEKTKALHDMLAEMLSVMPDA